MRSFHSRPVSVRKPLLLLCLFAAFGAGAQQKDTTAENMMLYQRSYGGWPKAIEGHKISYDHTPDEALLKTIRAGKDADDATIDNKATTREIAYLVKAYKNTGNKAYLEAAGRGIGYLLQAQYDNGGWPQYYPCKKLYRTEITYNDDAMVNVLHLLQDVAERKEGYAALDTAYAAKAREAVRKGIGCILRTQVTVNGKLTAWAAQYEEHSLVPAKARAFELPSLASSESAGIVLFLMRQPAPDTAIQKAILAAAAWFEAVKIRGYRSGLIDAPEQPTGKDRILTADSSSTIWARFYDLDQMEPQFAGRDSVPKKKLADIENERRAGYAWYGSWGQKVAEELVKWQKRNRQ